MGILRLLVEQEIAKTDPETLNTISRLRKVGTLKELQDFVLLLESQAGFAPPQILVDAVRDRIAEIVPVVP